jgi:hypothetical protein
MIDCWFFPRFRARLPVIAATDASDLTRDQEDPGASPLAVGRRLRGFAALCEI